jgi:amino acid permease
MGNTAEEATGLSTLHMVAYTANFIVGSGFLTIPWAMTQCGIMLGTLTVIAIACLAMVASDCVLEALARAGPCAAKQKRASCDDRPRTRIAMSPPTRRSADERAENGVYGSVLQNELSAGDPSGRELIVGDERQDMTDLCEIFMGKRGGTAYIVTVVIYLYASLWAYAVLFAQVSVVRTHTHTKTRAIVDRSMTSTPIDRRATALIRMVTSRSPPP